MKSTSLLFFDDIAELELLEGLPYISASYMSDSFRAKLTDAKIPPRSYISKGYDMAGILVEAFEAVAAGKAATPADYIRGLKDYPTAAGHTTIAPDGVFDTPAQIIVTHHGEKTLWTPPAK